MSWWVQPEGLIGSLLTPRQRLYPESMDNRQGNHSLTYIKFSAQAQPPSRPTLAGDDTSTWSQ